MIPFFSRHIPTPAQQATVRERFGELEMPLSPTFEPGRVVSQVLDTVIRAEMDRLGSRYEAHDLIVPVGSWHEHGREERYLGEHEPCHEYAMPGGEMRREWCIPKRVAGVFPGWALLELVRDGWSVVEFVNEPSARTRGTFICRGAYVHTLDASEWIACPVPADEQEPSGLWAGARRGWQA